MEVYKLLVIILPCMSTMVGCCSVTDVNTIANHRLLGHAYKNTTEMDLSSCVSRCKSDPYCLSVNYNFLSQRCEFNYKNAIMAPGYLERWPVEFYAYVERIPIERPCVFISCQNGGECEFDQRGLRIWCRCKNGYRGRRCEECGNDPLGLQDGRIPDSSFSASSYNGSYSPHMARLEGPKSWMPQDNDTNKYLQIDFAPHRYVIAKIAVSGDKSGYYALSYKVKYKEDNGKWTSYGREALGSFAEALFMGPPYPGGTKYNPLDPPIKTTAIRILPQGSSPAYRLELYGCRLTE